MISRGHVWLESCEEGLSLDGWPSRTQTKAVPCLEPESRKTFGLQHLKSEYFNRSVLSLHNNSGDCAPVEARRGHEKLEKAALRENYTNNSDRLAKGLWTGRVRPEMMGCVGPNDWLMDARRSLEFGWQRTRGEWTGGYRWLIDVVS